MSEEYSGWEPSIAYRDDLDEAIGFVVAQPPHRLQESGGVSWGKSLAGSGDHADVIWEEFAGVALEAVGEDVPSDSPLPPFQRQFPVHRYDHPPAAQSIPEIAIILRERGKPILQNINLVAEAATYIIAGIAGVRGWFGRKSAEVPALNLAFSEMNEAPAHVFMEPGVYLTQGALATLIIADLIGREGYLNDLEVDMNARGFVGCNSPGHPNSRMLYLVRLAYGGHQYGYSVDSSGVVYERFRVDDGELVSLPVPDLFTGELLEYDRFPAERKLKLRMGEAS